jgi:Tol biopolymer transport system component
VRIVTCSLVAALVLAVPASADGGRDLVAPLDDGSIAFVSRDGELAGVVAGRPAPGGYAALRPVWSPDGTRVAFSQGGIVADLDGTQHRLTTSSGGGFDVEPTWSPDGTQIAFRRDRGSGMHDLEAVPATGGPVRALTTDGGYKLDPKWQPHGNLVLFQGYQPEAGIYVVDVAGGTPRRIAEGVGSAAWAPDGSAVARGAAYGLELLAPDGTGARVLVPKANVANIADVAWSADGRRIAFTVVTQFPQYGAKLGIPTQSDVFVVDRDGTNLTRLTGFASDTPFDRPGAGTPRWWPGGSTIFFLSARRVWMMNADGTCEQPFVTELRMADVPIWSPHAEAAPALDCASAQIRVHADRAEVGVHSDVGLSVVVRNDGTRTLETTRLELSATRGTLRIANGSDMCTRGREIVCSLGSLPRGAEGTLELLGTPGQVGLVRYNARVVWDGPADVNPQADLGSAFSSVAPCDILGTWGPDYLVGTVRADRICARPGPDRIDGGPGNDSIDAGSGADTVIGGRGRDTIRGGGGGDLIYVRDGERDVVNCGTEQDTVVADQLDVLRHCERVTRVRVRR